MTLEEEIRLHKELSLKIEELEEQKKAIGQQILQKMSGKSLHIGRYFVRRYSRLSITTSLIQARQYDAVKLEEVVDKEKIKMLHKSGQTIPGAKELDYIVVSIQEDALTT